MSNEADLVEWLRQHRPAIACGLDYCISAEEVRALLNQHSGLSIMPGDDAETAYRRYLQAFERQDKKCRTQ